MTTATSITVRVPLRIRRRPGRKTVVTPMAEAGADAAIRTCADPALVKALARAFRYQRLLEEGRYASITEMAEAERIERGYLGTLTRLTRLAPELIEAVLNGRQSKRVNLPSLLERFSTGWAEQVSRWSQRDGSRPKCSNVRSSARSDRSSSDSSGHSC